MIWIDGILVSEGESGVYGERVVQGYRVWDPYRSKFAALATRYRERDLDLTGDQKVLYLGAANGTTVSHVADYVEVVYAVEFAPHPMQDLVMVARRRKNVIPIMADAGRPEQYAPLLEQVDMLYQDVAQPTQVSIAIANLIFLRPGGQLILMLKSRSVDVSRDPEEVAAEAAAALTAAGLVVESIDWLAPYHPDHAALICRKGTEEKD
jgi:fibrillarin-like pre-rRNA processing protein